MSEKGFVERFRSCFEGPNTIGNSRGFWVGFIAALTIAFAYPLSAGGYQSGITALFLVYAILALSLSFVWGYSGVLSFGQVVFFGFGGYTFGIVTLNFDSTIGIMAAIPIAVAIATLVAFGLGYFMFYGRVTGVFVAIITLVTTIVMQTFMAQTAGSEWAIGDARLGGFNGMTGIPDIALGIRNTSIAFSGETFYWLCLILLVASYMGLRALTNGKFGYAMVGIREDEDRVEMLGYDVRRVKLTVFTIGGALAGVAGVLYASWGNYIDPTVFSLTFATLPVIWVTVGGRESLLGAGIAAVGIEWFRQQLSNLGSDYALVVVGMLLLVVVLVLPEGIVPYVHRKAVSVYREYSDSGDDPDHPTRGSTQEEIIE